LSDLEEKEMLEEEESKRRGRNAWRQGDSSRDFKKAAV
jgi:hypothetical protein